MSRTNIVNTKVQLQYHHCYYAHHMLCLLLCQSQNFLTCWKKTMDEKESRRLLLLLSSFSFRVSFLLYVLKRSYELVDSRRTRRRCWMRSSTTSSSSSFKSRQTPLFLPFLLFLFVASPCDLPSLWKRTFDTKVNHLLGQIRTKIPDLDWLAHRCELIHVP